MNTYGRRSGKGAAEDERNEEIIETVRALKTFIPGWRGKEISHTVIQSPSQSL